MTTLRRRISSAFPKHRRTSLTAAARRYDRLVGRMSARARPGAVCMLHVGRSGSTVLGNMLDQHPRIRWDAEIYYTARALVANGSMRDPGGPDAWMAWTREQFAISGRRFYGFECKIGPGIHQDVDNIGLGVADYVAACRDIGATHFVLLSRRNILRRAASAVIGQKRGDRHLDRGGKAELTRVHLPVDPFLDEGPGWRLRDYLAEVEDRYAAARAAVGPDLTELVFEEDVMPGPEAGYKRICHAMGVEPRPVEVRNARTNPFPVRDMLSNADEVAAHLSGTPFAWMLDD